MKYIYGPVKSRRLGLSLGISLTPYKICTFDCIYCQLGMTTQKTTQRQEYVKTEEIIQELKSWLVNNPEEAKNLQFITLSGAGEPTLNIKIGEVIGEIKKITSVAVAVITNTSLFNDVSLRQALLKADLIVPSLDAVTQQIFCNIDRPQADIGIEGIIEGLVNFRREFRGKIWLEVMLIKGINDDLRQVKRLKEVTERINPDKIQLNSPVRTAAEPNIFAVEKKKLEKIKEILGDRAEII